MLDPAQVDADWLKSRLTVDNGCENVDPDTISIEGQSLENSFRLRALENMPQLMKARTEESKVRDIAPSKATPTECQVIVREHEVPGERISVRGLSKIASEDDRYRIVGDCIHHVFCGIEHLSDAQITTLIASYGLAEILSAKQLRAAWNRLMTISGQRMLQLMSVHSVYIKMVKSLLEALTCFISCPKRRLSLLIIRLAPLEKN